MTYKELYGKALWDLEHDNITLGEFERITEPLNKEIPKEEQADGDLISRKDTIEWLKKVTVTDGITFETGFKQILTDIKQMPSAEKTAEWISVRKQKPEDYEEVIATVRYDYKDKQEYEVVTVVRYSKEDGWEWAYEAGADYWESINGVVAWQPLPKPYEVKR